MYLKNRGWYGAQFETIFFLVNHTMKRSSVPLWTLVHLLVTVTVLLSTFEVSLYKIDIEFYLQFFLQRI